MDQVVKVSKESNGFDAQGDYWCFGLVRVVKGTVRFVVDGKKTDSPGNQFAVVLPPRSLVEVVLSKDTETLNSAILAQGKPPEGFPKGPVSFASEMANLPVSRSDISALIKSRENEIDISRSTRPHVISDRVKKYIEEDFQSSESFSAFAKSLKTSQAVLSRTFKKDFGMTPIQFRSWLRVVDSMRRLLESEAIVDVAQDVGFNDLSRFYKQFQKIFGKPPGAFIPKKSQKTPRT
jgi:AraC-like DNA-binding protein